MDMVLVLVLAVGAAALLLIAAGALRMWRRRWVARHHTRELRNRFGPEYDRVVALEGRYDGERSLRARLDRYADLDHPMLAPATRRARTEKWRQVQFGFIDAPEQSVHEAEHLVVTVLRERGYPTEDAVVRADALSVDEPELAESYRAAHRAFALAERGHATSEQLLGAILTYRELFEQLLGSPREEATTGHATASDREPASVAAAAAADGR